MVAHKFRNQVRITLLLVFAGAVFPSVAATKVQTAGLQYQIDKTPAWIEKIASPASVSTASPSGGSTQILLSDTQVNLMGAKPVTYFHGKSVARERSGLESISSVRIQFNPRYETLTLHDLAVFRDGKRIDRLKTARIDLAQRERRLDEGVYDEDVEAIIALTDVRVGDSVEYGYSVSGANPIFGGKHSGFFVLNGDRPIARLAVRIQYPANRKISYRLYRSESAVTETIDKGVRKLQLDAEGIPAIRTEEAVPVWFGVHSSLQVSEYESWEDVGVWAKGLYETPSNLSPEIEAVLDKFKAEAKTPEELAAMALAWVQNEIRYYSIVVGTSSHRPNHPNVTVQQRFGDCKDKSLLLSAMLQKMGIRAEPALVSYHVRKRVADLLPTPYAFDHVIVRAQVGGQTYWLDGTRTYQGRKLENLGFLPFGKSLVVTSTPSRELVDVVAPATRRTGSEIQETFKVAKFGVPTTMLVEQKYYGAFAEWFRNQMAANGVRRSVEVLQSEYGRDFPNISLSGDATVQDDPSGNVVTLTQAFNIPQAFTYEAGRAKMSSIYGRSIVPWIRFPGSPDRKFPLALPFPETFDHRIVLDLPIKAPGAVPPPETWRDSHYALANRIVVDGTKVTFNYSARTLRDHVSTADFPGFSEKFKRASGMLFSSLSVPLVENSQLRDRLTRDLEKSKINLRNPDQLDTFQQRFLRDYAIADESIRGGLIAGSLLAKAYKDRAEAASLLGRKADALADVTKAIELDGNDAAYVLKAEVQLYSGNYQDAITTLGQVAQEANKANTLVAAGMANFYLAKYDAAQSSFSRAAEIAGAEELPYSLIWLALSARKAGGEPESAVKQHLPRLGAGWPAEAVTFLLGNSEEDKLIAAAKQEEKESRLRLCEAYFYLGQKALVDGKFADAKRWFGKSVDTGAVMYREHIFAQQELKRLERY